MVDHSDTGRRLESDFHPVDGISGVCDCGHVFNYIAYEGETTCPECGRTYNLYVESEIIDE